MSSFLTRASKTALALVLGAGLLVPASVAQATPVVAAEEAGPVGTAESEIVQTPSDDRGVPEPTSPDPGSDTSAQTDAPATGASVRPPEKLEEVDPVAPDGQPGEVPLTYLDPNLRGDVAIPLAAAGIAGLPSDGFNPGYILSEGNMYAGSSLTAAQIQRLLEREVPSCEIGDPGKEAGKPIYGSKVADVCLRDLKLRTGSRAANAYCSAYAGAASETAAQIIAKVGRACGISPKVLLVRLQIEQGLVTDSWPTVYNYSFAMGWNCPDSGPGNSANCNDGAAGFLDQVYGGAWQLKRYQARPGEYNYRAGRNNTIQWHPNKSCGTSSVYIKNQATAALYIYTPYRPNDAALRAGWGTGDACSSYGNRNFYQYYRAWFESSTTRYGDIPPSYVFYKHIEWMGAQGYAASGTDAPAFNPANATTRGAMATFLRRMIEPGYTPSANLKLPYADVPKSNPHYAGIAWMYERGYAAKAAKFNPGSSTTRGAMATFLYRLEDGAKDGVTAKPPYTDVPADSTHAKGIAWMAKQGYAAAGPSNPEFRSADPVSRGAMAAFLYRIYA